MMNKNDPETLVEHYCEAKHIGRAFVEAFEVWHSYVLGNEKWLFGVVVDGYKSDLLFEVTYNRSKEEIYIDEYKKVENCCLSDKQHNTYATIREQMTNPAPVAEACASASISN